MSNKDISHLIWTAIVFILITVNAIYFASLYLWINDRTSSAAMGGFALMPQGLGLAVINLFAVICYFIARHPRGVVRIISIIVLSIVLFMLLYFGALTIYSFA